MRNMQRRKVESYIGFAVKSKSVVYGLDNVLTYRKKMYLIVTDSTLGDASRRKLDNYLVSHTAMKLVVLQDFTLAETLKRDNCKIIGITNESLAGAVLRETENNG